MQGGGAGNQGQQQKALPGSVLLLPRVRKQSRDLLPPGGTGTDTRRYQRGLVIGISINQLLWVKGPGCGVSPPLLLAASSRDRHILLNIRIPREALKGMGARLPICKDAWLEVALGISSIEISQLASLDLPVSSPQRPQDGALFMGNGWSNYFCIRLYWKKGFGFKASQQEPCVLECDFNVCLSNSALILSISGLSFPVCKMGIIVSVSRKRVTRNKWAF